MLGVFLRRELSELQTDSLAGMKWVEMRHWTEQEGRLEGHLAYWKILRRRDCPAHRQSRPDHRRIHSDTMYRQGRQMCHKMIVGRKLEESMNQVCNPPLPVDPTGCLGQKNPDAILQCYNSSPSVHLLVDYCLERDLQRN